MRRLFPVTLALAVFPVCAVGQSLSELCDEIRTVNVGQWAEYAMTAPQLQQGPANMRFAIVGREQADGERHYWHETKAETPMGTMITQMLVPGFPFDPAQVKRMVMKMGDQPAMDVSEAMLTMIRSQMGNNPAIKTASRCGDTSDVEEVGWETVSVPAGSFRALHLRSTELKAEWWISKEASFGMVKFVGLGGQEMVLVGHGSDAQSSLNERQ